MPLAIVSNCDYNVLLKLLAFLKEHCMCCVHLELTPPTREKVRRQDKQGLPALLYAADDEE